MITFLVVLNCAILLFAFALSFYVNGLFRAMLFVFPHLVVKAGAWLMSWVAVRFFMTADGKSLVWFLLWMMTKDADLEGDSYWKVECASKGLDYQLCEGSQRMPFELRPIAIEEQLRRRYYRKQAVWVGTSTARTVMPIDMFGTPTITGGGTGYVSTGTDKDTLVCYQTTAGLQTLVLNSELV